MKRNILIGMVLFSSLISCEKDDEIENADSIIYFTGISMTDDTGYPLSEPDTTDWRFDDNWTTKEENLFSISYGISDQVCLTEIFLYPNPFQDIFRIQLNNLPNSSRLELRLVNKDFETIFQNDSINSSVTIMLDNISVNDTLRLYYKLIDSMDREFKGHGDILTQK